MSTGTIKRTDLKYLKKRVKVSISGEGEELHLKALHLHNDRFNEENLKGVALQWYGGRLRMIRNFYRKTTVEVGYVIGVYDTQVSRYEQNKDKPSEDKIKQLALMFDVPEALFTEHHVSIDINQQDKIQVLWKSGLNV